MRCVLLIVLLAAAAFAANDTTPVSFTPAFSAPSCDDEFSYREAALVYTQKNYVLTVPIEYYKVTLNDTTVYCSTLDVLVLLAAPEIALLTSGNYTFGEHAAPYNCDDEFTVTAGINDTLGPYTYGAYGNNVCVTNSFLSGVTADGVEVVDRYI